MILKVIPKINTEGFWWNTEEPETPKMFLGKYRRRKYRRFHEHLSGIPSAIPKKPWVDRVTDVLGDEIPKKEIPKVSSRIPKISSEIPKIPSEIPKISPNTEEVVKYQR